MSSHSTSDHRLKPGSKIRLDKISTKAPKDGPDRDEADRRFADLREELIRLQYRLYAEGKRKLLVVFQAMDAGGKDGAIRHVFKGVNPQGVRVTSFKAPSSLELAHDYLWRIHQAVPAAGMIGVFNRSHYEDVLVVRVDNLVPKEVWTKRYDQINAFENLLAESGTVIVKFYLHISREEQAERFEERRNDPEKKWKYSAADIDKSRQWDDYMKAYDDVLERCSTDHAPWYIIPSDNKWYRTYAITEVLVETLRAMDLKLPTQLAD